MPYRRAAGQVARGVGHDAHRLLRRLGALAAVAILVLLVGIWRLLQGPIELNWLAPYVEAGFERSGIGFKVAISGVRFGIDRATHQLDLRTENVRIALPDGEPLATFPEMVMSFGIGPLLRGRIAPTQMAIERPVLHLTRDAAGGVSAQIEAGDQAAGALGPQMLEQLAGPPERNTPFGSLRRLAIRGATVILDDRRTGQTWRADRVDIAVERGGNGIAGDISLALPMGASLPELHASYRYIADQQILELDMSIDGVQPSAIPALIPELAQLRHVEAPVSGTLKTRIDMARGGAQGSRLDLAFGPGRLLSEWLPTGSLSIEKGHLRATYAPERHEVRVESLALDLGAGTDLVLDGSLTGVTPELFAAAADARPPGRIRGQIAGTLKHVPMAKLGNLWPMALSPGGRRWTLANVHDGVLDEASVQLVLDIDPVGRTAHVRRADGRLRYHDLTVDYFKGLAPVRKVGGTAVFANDQVEFLPTSGIVKGIKLAGGSLRVTNLDDPIEWLTIDLALAGPLQDALEIIDSKPLHYARAIGVNPAQVAGRTETRLRFKLPLVDDLKFSAVEYSAKSTITGASVAKILLDRGIRDGNFTLDVTRTGAQARGAARYDGIPAKLDANIFFQPKNGPSALYRAEMTLDDDAQRRLGLDFLPDRLSGPIALDATYTAFAENRGEATALLDLRGATISIPEAGWKKPPGQPGTAKIVLDLDHQRISRIRQLDISAPGLDGRLTALLGADRRQLDRVEIRHLAVGESTISGAVARRAGGGWRADIQAGRLDGRHLLKDATSSSTPPGSTPQGATPPLAINARIERLVLGPKRELHQVSADLLRGSDGVWQSGNLAGRYANGRQMSLRFGEGGGRRVVFQSDDLGATLSLLDVTENIVGGRISIDGQLSDAAGQRVLRAQVEGRDYMVMRASVMARLLALPSLTGFASTLTGTGLPFSTLRGTIVYSGNRITLERVLAFGEALGVTANGWIDIDRDQIELQGTVAPAYALNSILDNIPIIGDLLGGGSQGLFAANYRLTGPIADPDINVNPLSALAPGILRQLFAPLVGFPPLQQERPPSAAAPQ